MHAESMAQLSLQYYFCIITTFIKDLFSKNNMLIEFLKDEKEEAKMKFPNENAIFANALKDELWSTKGVEIVTLDKRHPLVGNPELVVHGKEPRKLIKTAAQNLKKNVEEFEKAILKEI